MAPGLAVRCPWTAGTCGSTGRTRWQDAGGVAQWVVHDADSGATRLPRTGETGASSGPTIRDAPVRKLVP